MHANQEEFERIAHQTLTFEEKGKLHSVTTHKVEDDDLPQNEMINATDFVKLVCTDARLTQGLDELNKEESFVNEPILKKKRNRFVAWVVNDCLTEEKEHAPPRAEEDISLYAATWWVRNYQHKNKPDKEEEEEKGWKNKKGWKHKKHQKIDLAGTLIGLKVINGDTEAAFAATLDQEKARVEWQQVQDFIRDSGRHSITSWLFKVHKTLSKQIISTFIEPHREYINNTLKSERDDHKKQIRIFLACLFFF